MNDQTYQTTVILSLRSLYDKMLSFLPNLLAAIIVLILGWLLAAFLSRLVKRVLDVIKIDQLADSLGMKNLGAKVGRDLSLSKLGAWLVKWFFFLGSFIAAADILGLSEVTRFLYSDVLAFAGNVIIAMAILLLGMMAARFFSDIVTSAVRASGWHTAGALGGLTKWSILVFAAIAALSQLKIGTAFLQDLFRAIIAMLAIAGGIAFGLGGKDHARKVLDALETDLSKKD
jgi:hypothetical protein